MKSTDVSDDFNNASLLLGVPVNHASKHSMHNTRAGIGSPKWHTVVLN